MCMLQSEYATHLSTVNVVHSHICFLSQPIEQTAPVATRDHPTPLRYAPSALIAQGMKLFCRSLMCNILLTVHSLARSAPGQTINTLGICCTHGLLPERGSYRRVRGTRGCLYKASVTRTSYSSQKNTSIYKHSASSWASVPTSWRI